MESTKVERLDAKVCDKVDTNVRRVRVSRRIGLLEPSLVPHCDEVVRVNGFDIGRDSRGPGVDGASGCVASA